MPLYAFGGPATVSLKLGEARVRLEGQDAGEGLRTVTIEPRATGHTVAEVKPWHGVPTLHINGQPNSGITWATYSPSVEVFRDFTRAGVDLFTFSGTPTEAGYDLSRTVWVAPGRYDYSEFDRRMLMVLEANPHAYIFPRLYLHAPAWWSKEHPDDVVLEDRGDGHPVPLVHAGNKPAPSWASEAWRRDTIDGLRRLIEHIETSPYADRVIGYHLTSGTTEEWMMWGANENQWVDYSPACLKAFRRWLLETYGSDQRLRAAWADPAVTLATASIPTRARRASARQGWLRDPATEADVIDFYRFNSDLVADTIRHFAKAVKDLTHHEKIVGVFYGYLLQLCGEQRQQNAGHLALGRVLASPDIDFVCSPTSYAFRQLGGEGTSHFMSLLGSVQLHGKLWFDENDIRTSLSGGEVGEWGRPRDVAGDLLQQDKELANCLVHGAAQWWFDVGGNRYHHPTLLARIGELRAKADEALQLDRSPADEVALAVDERSLCSLRVGDPLGAWLLVSQLPALHRIGAPVGHYLVTDLPRLGDRKLFFIPTSFAPTAADRRAIDALKRDGHVLVFCGARDLSRRPCRPRGHVRSDRHSPGTREQTRTTPGEAVVGPRPDREPHRDDIRRRPPALAALPGRRPRGDRPRHPARRPAGPRGEGVRHLDRRVLVGTPVACFAPATTGPACGCPPVRRHGRRRLGESRPRGGLRATWRDENGAPPASRRRAATCTGASRSATASVPSVPTSRITRRACSSGSDRRTAGHLTSSSLM